MKAKKIIYERLINTGNFSHEKIGIEIELSQKDTAQDAIDLAKTFVEKQINQPSEHDRVIAERVTEFDNDDIPF